MLQALGWALYAVAVALMAVGMAWVIARAIP
jgi:hypothetical protein